MKLFVTSIVVLLSIISGVSGQAFDTVDVIIRDFNASHPDFQEAPHPCGPFMVKGLVQDTLDAERNPIPVANFPSICNETPDQLHIGDWFRTTAENTEYCVPLIMNKVPGTEKTFQLVDDYFFPLDTVPTATELMTGDDKLQHNFHFCMEMHANFKYRGGEVFNFYGDDDVWVFINNKLALDLGNVHTEQEDSVELDMYSEELGISVGGYYNFDLFYCERQATGSHIKLTSSFDLLPPPPPGLYIADLNKNIIMNDTITFYQNGIADTLTSIQLRNRSEAEGCTTIESQIKEFTAGNWTFAAAALPVNQFAIINANNYTPGTYLLTLSDGISQDQVYIKIVERPQTATPVISPVTPFEAYTDITIASATPGAVIYYTLDGSDPVPGVSPQYSSAIRLTNTTTVKAIATATNYRPSIIATAVITRSHTQSKLEIVNGTGSPLDTIYSNAASISIRLNTNFYDTSMASVSAVSGGDAEALVLITATAPQAGFAAAYLNNFPADTTAAAPGNGNIELMVFSKVIVTWTNPLDPADITADTVIVVPAPKIPGIKFIDSQGNEITSYSDLQGGSFQIVVSGNTINPNAPDVLTLNLVSDDGDQMSVSVTETGIRTGVYISTAIPFKFSETVTPGDGFIEGRLDADLDDSRTIVTATLGTSTSDLLLISGFVRVRKAYITDSDKDGVADIIYIQFVSKLPALPNSVTSIDWPAEGTNNFSAEYNPDPSLSEIGFQIAADGTVDSSLVVVVLRDANEIFGPGLTAPTAENPPTLTVNGFSYLLEDQVEPVLIAVVKQPSSLKRYMTAGDSTIRFYPDTLIITLSEPIVTGPNAPANPWTELLVLSLDSTRVPISIIGTPVMIDSVTYQVVIDNSEGLVTPQTTDDIALNPAADFTDKNQNGLNELPVPVEGGDGGISSVTNQFRNIISGTEGYGPNFGTESITVIGADGGVQGEVVVPRLTDANIWVPPVQLTANGTIDRNLPCSGTDNRGEVAYPAGCLVSLIILTEKQDGPYTAQVSIFNNLGLFVQSITQDFGKCGEYENPLRKTEYGQFFNDIVWNQRNVDGALVGNGVYIWKVHMTFEDGKQRKLTKLMGIARNSNMDLSGCAAGSAMGF